MRNFIRSGLTGLFLALGATGTLAGPSYNVHVAGLACPFCAYGIEKTLGAIDGVESAQTDLEAGVVAVEMADGATLSRAQVEKAVEKAGFTLKDLEETGE